MISNEEKKSAENGKMQNRDSKAAPQTSPETAEEKSRKKKPRFLKMVWVMLKYMIRRLIFHYLKKLWQVIVGKTESQQSVTTGELTVSPGQKTTERTGMTQSPITQPETVQTQVQ